MRRLLLYLAAALLASSARTETLPPETLETADRAVQGDVTVIGISWQFKDGKIDWLFNPTDTKGPRNAEWLWQLNRMYFWTAMAKAYRSTGDEKYARAFAAQLESWLDQLGGVPPETNYNDVGSPWRTIEEGLRLMGSWHTVWRVFAKSAVFTPKLKERFRASARAQANHLMRHPSGSGNWLLMEMNGAYVYATDFPDDPDSAKIRKEASERLSKALEEQILPDGFQYELSPDYHSVAVRCAVQMYETAVRTGFDGALPSSFKPLLARMADALLAMTTPVFTQPRFNDCYTMHGDRLVARIAPFFPERTDLAWFASARVNGAPPVGATASRYLPWSGFAVMRSDWGPDATYLCFDVGPIGESLFHGHQDKLSFNLYKGGEELVFEDGGGSYDDSEERLYGKSGYDHNTLLVDGLAQNRAEPRIAPSPIDAQWMTTPERDSAVGVYDQGFGPAEKCLARQRRTIVFDRTKDAFILTDEVSSSDGAEHVYELLFQLPTTNTVISVEGRHLVAHYGKRYDLEISAVEGGTLSTLSMQRQPRLAGWFIGRNDRRTEPATTAILRALKCRDVCFITVLKPIEAP